MFSIAVDIDLVRNSSRYEIADIGSRIPSRFHWLSPDTYSFFSISLFLFCFLSLSFFQIICWLYFKFNTCHFWPWWYGTELGSIQQHSSMIWRTVRSFIDRQVASSFPFRTRGSVKKGNVNLLIWLGQFPHHHSHLNLSIWGQITCFQVNRSIR